MSKIEVVSTESMLSAPQEVVFYIYTVSGIYSRPLKFFLQGEDSLDNYSSRDIKLELLARDPVHYVYGDASGMVSEYVDFEIEIENLHLETESLHSKVGILSIDSDSRYSFKLGTEYKNILFGPSDVNFFGERVVSDSVFNFFIEDFRPFVIIGGWKYNKILWKANVAIPIGFKQNFWLNDSDQRVFRKILDTSFNLGDTRPKRIINSIFTDIIDGLFSSILTYTQDDFVLINQNIDYADTSVPFVPSVISTRVHVYSAVFDVSITEDDGDGNLYSPQFSFISTGSDLSPLLIELTKVLSYTDVAGLYSSNMVMIQVTADSNDYEIRDLEPFYSNAIKPTVTIYDDDRKREDSFGFLQEIASFNSFKNTSGLLSAETRAIIPKIEVINVDGIVYDLVKVSIWENTLSTSDTDSILSNGIELLIGVFSPDNRFGLNRFIYIDDTTRKDNDPSIPWFNKGGNLFTVKNTHFTFIYINEIKSSKIRISGFSSNDIIQDWEAWWVSDSRLEIGIPKVEGYLEVLNLTSGAKIVFSRGDMHSTIVSFTDSFMTNEEQGLFYGTTNRKLIDVEAYLSENESFDTGSFERKASILLSAKYKKYSEKLRRMSTGTVYDQWMVDETLEYLTSSEAKEVLVYFEEFQFNPFIAARVTLNRDIESAKLNIFDAPRVVTYNGASAIVNSIEFRPTDTKMTDIVSTRIASVSQAKAMIDIDNRKFIFENTKVSSIIDPCGLSSLCKAKLIKGMKQVLTKHSSKSIFIGDYSVIINTPIEDGKYLSSSVFEKRWNLGIQLMINFDSVAPYDQEDSRIVDTLPVTSNEINQKVKIEANAFVRDFVNGIRSTFQVVIPLNEDISGFHQGESFVNITTSSIVHGIEIPGSVEVEGVDTNSVGSPIFEFRLQIGSSMLESTVSDFKAIVSVIKPKYRSIKSTYSPNGRMLINEKLKSASGFYHRDFIWLKTFFPTTIDGAFIQSKIMDFNISELDQHKNFYIPFVYVDETSIDGESLPGKPGQPDISEKALKEFDTPDIKRGVASTGFICGMMSYLDYQGYNHIYTVGSSIIFGNTSVQNRELLNSGYIRAVLSPVITQGKKISEADMFQRSLVDLGVSYLDDVDAVLDWNMEDFKLEVDDFQNGIDPADLDRFGEVTATGISNILDTIGKDIEVDEQMKKLSYFPEFEDRPAEYDNSLETTIEINQYLVSTEEEVIDV